MMARQLLVLGCSQAKRESSGLLPALDRYDGPHYRILRKFLRENQWPTNLSVAVLSAKHGLFGSLKGIEYYDERMNPASARAHAKDCVATLTKWAKSHDTAYLSLGKDYIPAVQPALDALPIPSEVFTGPIGVKSHKLKRFLAGSPSTARVRAQVEGGTGRCTYFLPDWDDLLDPSFDFEGDSFSKPSRDERNDKHCAVLMQPKRMCDGFLVSLAQRGTSKGPLRRLEGTEASALYPVNLRSRFGLADDQFLFGDCGAFSYVNEETPAMTVEQAVSLYELYGFDFGASVDHIPVRQTFRDGESRALPLEERQGRVDVTKANAELFIRVARERKSVFNPVGTIQALCPEQFAQSVRDYYDFGYRHLAIGGLVPLSDGKIEDIVRAVMSAAEDLKERPWIHLFGVFRPKLQRLFRELEVDSFDSASYFRKAWLRSDQNYLSVDGEWFAALRVPMTSDGRTRKRMLALEADIQQLERQERKVLSLLSKYDRDEAAVGEVLDAVMGYDNGLTRSSEKHSMRSRYRRTLEERPWRRCDCPFCKDVGIHMLIFRGANRNKRRGAHNTLMLYQRIGRRQ